MNSARVIVLVLVGLVILGSGSAHSDFCGDLATIRQSAVDGFSGARGELVSRHVDPLSDTRVVWQCALVLTGVRTCEVAWQKQAYTYNTFWHKKDEQANAETFEALQVLLDGCGLIRKGRSRSGRSIWWIVEGEDNLDITLAYNARRVRLSLSTVGFPNP